MQPRPHREMLTYSESNVKALCWDLLNSFTNIEDLNDPIRGYWKDFERWFEQNKKQYKDKTIPAKLDKNRNPFP